VLIGKRGKKLDGIAMNIANNTFPGEMAE